MPYASPEAGAAETEQSAPRADTVPLDWSWIDRGRVPGLDGLRAISIAMVLLAHSGSSHGIPVPAGLSWITRFGGRGVDVFFVISGFLITLLLLRERDQRGSISLRGFYLRRLLRITPAYVVFLAIMGICSLAGVFQIPFVDWSIAFAYVSSLVSPWHDISWNLAHTWSLAVEEHFYLLWPLLFLLCSRTRLVALLSFGVMLAPLLRFILWSSLNWKSVFLDVFTPTRYDTIAIGCLLALFCRNAWFRNCLKPCRGMSTILFFGAILGWIVSSGLVASGGFYTVTLKRDVDAVMVCVMIIAIATDGTGMFGGILNSRPFVATGVLSYSLYLWHMPFFSPQADLFVCQWPVNLLCVIACALSSYYLVERPFLSIKDRVSHKQAHWVEIEPVCSGLPNT